MTEPQPVAAEPPALPAEVSESDGPNRVAAAVHQLCSTHCTAETSALRGRHGAGGGYGPRAGSLPPEALRDAWKLTDGLASTYRLPADLPGDRAAALAPEAAPVRLAFADLTDSDGTVRRVVARVVHRGQDSLGRVGSYFAHVLLADHDSAAEGAVEALRLWGAAGWRDRDFPAGDGAALPTLAELGALLEGRPPALDDAALVRFLTAEPDGDFGAAAALVPRRWQVRPADDRRGLLRRWLASATAMLADGAPPRGAGPAVLAIAEPPFAALLFYALFRLTPPSAVPPATGFSTYETSAGGLGQAAVRLPLAATSWFADPASLDALPDKTACGLLFDTRDPALPSDAAGNPQAGFAGLAIESLLRGTDVVETLLQRADELRVASAAGLEELATAHAAVQELLDPAATAVDPVRLASPAAAAYGAQLAADAIADRPPSLGGQNVLALLGLLRRFRVDSPAFATGLDVIARMDLDQVAPLVAQTLADGREKAYSHAVAAARRFLRERRRLPPCGIDFHAVDLAPDDGVAPEDRLARGGGRPPNEGGSPAARLWSDLLATAPADVLQELETLAGGAAVARGDEPDTRRERFLRSLLRHEGAARDTAATLIDGLSDSAFCRLVRRHGLRPLRAGVPTRHRPRWRRIVGGLMRRPDSFGPRLDVLERALHADAGPAGLPDDCRRAAEEALALRELIERAHRPVRGERIGDAIAWADETLAHLARSRPTDDPAARLRWFVTFAEHPALRLREGAAACDPLPESARRALRDRAAWPQLGDAPGAAVWISVSVAGAAWPYRPPAVRLGVSGNLPPGLAASAEIVVASGGKVRKTVIEPRVMPPAAGTGAELPDQALLWGLAAPLAAATAACVAAALERPTAAWTAVAAVAAAAWAAGLALRVFERGQLPVAASPWRRMAAGVCPPRWRKKVAPVAKITIAARFTSPYWPRPLVAAAWPVFDITAPPLPPVVKPRKAAPTVPAPNDPSRNLRYTLRLQDGDVPRTLAAFDAACRPEADGRPAAAFDQILQADPALGGSRTSEPSAEPQS